MARQLAASRGAGPRLPKNGLPARGLSGGAAEGWRGLAACAEPLAARYALHGRRGPRVEVVLDDEDGSINAVARVRATPGARL